MISSKRDEDRKREEQENAKTAFDNGQSPESVKKNPNPRANENLPDKDKNNNNNEKKAREFVDAPNGIIGLESNIGVLLAKLVHAGKLPLARFVEAWTTAPARCT